MSSLPISIILGVISLIIFKDYFDIFFEQKQIRFNSIFWVVCLATTSILEYRFSLPLMGLLSNTIFAFLVMILKYEGNIKEETILIFSLYYFVVVCGSCSNVPF